MIRFSFRYQDYDPRTQIRQREQKVANLYEAISEEGDREMRFSLSAENLIRKLRQDFENTSNIVDISEALKCIQVFKSGAFDEQPITVQA